MQLHFIRNATMRLHYGGRLIIADPYLAGKHAYPPFAGISPNPLVDLPIPASDVLAGAEMGLVSHLHSDHFDDVAVEMLDKSLPLFCQPQDEARLKAKGFQNVKPIAESAAWEGITLTRTPAQHGSGAWIERMGHVCGFVLQAEGEPTLYWAGDTIWYEPVAQTIAAYQPDVIITHSGGAKFGDAPPIVMDIEQTLTVCQAAPQATVIAIHLEALDHCTVSRADLRSAAETAGIEAGRFLIPADGEVIKT